MSCSRECAERSRTTGMQRLCGHLPSRYFNSQNSITLLQRYVLPQHEFDYQGIRSSCTTLPPSLIALFSFFSALFLDSRTCRPRAPPALVFSPLLITSAPLLIPTHTCWPYHLETRVCPRSDTLGPRAGKISQLAFYST